MAAPLYLLPFDHRSSFARDLLGVAGQPGEKDKARIRELKQIVYEGFLNVWQEERERPVFGILVDEEYGADILRSARDRGVQTAVPVERSGQQYFDFEYGPEFREHILRIQPTWVKALVRYHPKNRGDNPRQLARLKELSDFCVSEGYPLLFELLVPPTPEDLSLMGGIEQYDSQLRWERTRDAIAEIREKVTVAVWKIEGVQRDQWPGIIDATGSDARIIVLGRGQDEQAVIRWLNAASAQPQIIGFAIGRTVFMQPLQQYLSGTLPKPEAVRAISGRFAAFVAHWRKLRLSSV